MYIETTATRKILELSKRLRAVSGGTSASKTISILMVLIFMSQKDMKPRTTHIVSESLPHLKLAAMADFLKIMKEQHYYDDKHWNRTDYIYTFETGSTIQFYGADSADKVHGPRRDRLFVNEANHVPFASFDQMEVRTNDTIFLDWNPTGEFWFYTEVLNQRKADLDFITVTYKDNEGLPESIVRSIEARRERKSWWKVYGLGELGDAEGKIYSDWQIIDEIPHEAQLVRRGLDFGYTNDPTTLIDTYYYNGGYIFDEQLYQHGMSNREIADSILSLPHARTLVIADSSEPKSIDDIKMKGVNIRGVVKGPDSIRQGIARLQGERISMTSRSVNLQREYKNYMWDSDRLTGKFLQSPEDSSEDHALDAARYSLDGYKVNTVNISEFRAWNRRARAGMV